MTRARHVGSVIGMFAIAILVATGCKKQVPAQTPAPPPPPQAAVPVTPPPPPAAAAARGRAEAGAADRGADLRAEDGGAIECGTAARRRVLRLRPVGGPRRWPRPDAEERGLAEALDEHADHGGRARRRARQLGVQPRARFTARHRGQGLPGQPWCPGQPDHRRQQGQGTAVLHDRVGRVLAAEPARALHHYGKK